MTIEILPHAKEDIFRGFDFYGEQAERLGHYFRDSILSDIDSLRDTAGVHAQVCGYHRSISEKFPFAIYYRITGEAVQIYAVFDCRRDPATIRRNLRRRWPNE
jgi:plasmid stabilization system protein ParE